MSFKAPVSDLVFTLSHVVDFAAVMRMDKFSDVDMDVAQAIIDEAGKFCAAELAELNAVGDREPASLQDGNVKTSPGFAEALQKISNDGWVGMLASQGNGGMGLPLSLATAVNEMMASANLSLSLSPLMTQGQIEALEHHASADVKQQFLPKLISGEWAGTMNLTEPAAGSDVGALASKATRNEDGSYAITGEKIFITWGDNDYSENICHLVLARLPDGDKGTKGISLFLVPKYLENEDGQWTVKNSLEVTGLEHKLGIHGSPTCVMSYDGARGWLIGEEHAGMKCMFTMMNNARLGVAAQGVGMAEIATQKALVYANERVQGASPIGRENGTIIDHADVRRMLATMRADTFAARAITFACATALDLGSESPEEAMKGAFLTPIAKAFATDIGHEVAQMGLQVHGGMGYIEETGVAQLARDARITSIYEGTNGIQAMDLVGRKLADKGAVAFSILDEIVANAEEIQKTFPILSTAVWNASESLRKTTENILALPLNDRFAGACSYLRAFARVLGAHYHLKAVCAEKNGKHERLARFYIEHLLPEYSGLAAAAQLGSSHIYAISQSDLEAS